jgi:hypothetical protein
MSECEQELRSTLEIRCPCSGALTSTGGRCVSRWTPRKRREFIRRLRLLGFDELFVGTRHSFMVYRNRRQALPSNPGYSVPQLRTLLRDREVELLLGRTISAEEWNSF